MSSTEEDGRYSRHSSGAEDDGMEELCFDEATGQEVFPISGGSKEIQVHPSDQLNESSPFHFNTIVDYTWETQYSHGRLICTHLSAMFIAYVVKVSNGGAVRVIDMESKERVLMKGDKGLIKDVDFLHKLDEVILGFIDEYGTFYINRITKEKKTGKLTTHALLKVTLDGSPIRLDNRRIIWCKHVPDGTDDGTVRDVAPQKDCTYHFAILENETIYAGNLMQLTHAHGEGPHLFNNVKDDFLKIDTHSSAVTDASFSPDGTALATCSKDGTVKFFQIYFQERAPARCLYSWAPHDGRPIDRIFFLDNHMLDHGEDNSQYWKYLVTAADGCSEFKLFSCRSWKCMQTLRFYTPGSLPSQWKVEVSTSGRYIMTTNIHNKAMYLLHVECSDTAAQFGWIREFSMPWNIIGFNISSAGRIRYSDVISKGYGSAVVGDQTSYRNEDIMNLVEINFIQPRSMQQGTVAVMSPPKQTPQTRARSPNSRRISFNRNVDRREFADEEKTNATVEGLVPSPYLNYKAGRSPAAERNNHVSPGIGGSQSKRRSASSISTSDNEKEVPPSAAEMSQQLSSLIGLSPASGPASNKTGTGSSRRKTPSPSPIARPIVPYVVGREPNANGSASKTSTSSSPSREVQEILSPKSTHSFVARGSGAVLEDGLENNNATLVDNADGKTLATEQINSLTELVIAQANEIRDLKKEMSRLSLMHLEGNQVLERQMKQTNVQFGRIEEMLRVMESPSKQNLAASSNIAEAVVAAVSSVVKKELDVIVPQTLCHVFEPSRLNVSSQIDRLSNMVEVKLAQSVTQILQRERVWETLSDNFQSITKDAFDNTFSDLFMKSVFPRCQTVVQDMLLQVNDTFRSGTKEYLTGLENVLEKERRREDFQGLVVQQMSSMQDAVSSALQVEIETQMMRVLSGIQTSVVRQVEQSVSQELNRAFQEQQRFIEMSVIPRTATPAVSVVDMPSAPPAPTVVKLSKQQVLTMAKSGDIKGAFALASTLGDVDLLLYICKNFEAGVLHDLNLPSSVHLSIMHLLASDLIDDTEVKYSYLSTCLTCLDLTDAKNLKGVTRLGYIYQTSVSRFQERYQNHPLQSSLKLLAMAFGRQPQQLKAVNSQTSLLQSSSARLS